MGGLRALVIGIVSLALIGCASKPESFTCSVLGGMGGAFAGGIGAGEFKANNESSAGSVAIGLGATAVGLGLGYVLCRPRREMPEKQLAQAPPAPAPQVARSVPPPIPEPPAPSLPDVIPPPLPVLVSDPCEGPVRLAGVHFDIAEATVRPDALVILSGVAEQLDRCGGTRLRIEAHSDSRGSDAYNLDLSRQRAHSVLNYLVEAGIAPARMEAVGFGESRPTAPNDTLEGRSENRRVELRPIE